MTTWIALLRAVNVAGHSPVAMADLRDVLTRFGCLEVRSLLQSGNLVFRRRARSGPSLERDLEREAANHLSLTSDIFVRTAEEWAEVVAANPFRGEARRTPGLLAVVFLKTAPAVGDVASFQSVLSGPERVRASGRQLYITYPDGMGRSKVTNALIERALGTRATARNWNTVAKLDAAARDRNEGPPVARS